MPRWQVTHHLAGPIMESVAPTLRPTSRTRASPKSATRTRFVRWSINKLRQAKSLSSREGCKMCSHEFTVVDTTFNNATFTDVPRLHNASAHSLSQSSYDVSRVPTARCVVCLPAAASAAMDARSTRCSRVACNLADGAMAYTFDVSWLLPAARPC